MNTHDYLIEMGYELAPFQARNSKIYLNKLHKVEVGPNCITVSDWKEVEENEGGNFHQQFHLVHKAMTIDQVISFLDMTSAVPYKAMLGLLADQSGISDKRAIYHIREAVKRAAV